MDERSAKGRIGLSILTTPDEVETWLTAEWDEAKDLQRPLPDVVLTEVVLMD